MKRIPDKAMSIYIWGYILNTLMLTIFVSVIVVGVFMGKL